MTQVSRDSPPCFHCGGLDLIPGQGIKMLQAGKKNVGSQALILKCSNLQRSVQELWAKDNGAVWAVINWSSKILPKEGSHLSESADFCYEKCTSCPSGIRIPQQNISPDHLSVTSALQAGIWKFGSGFTSALQICHTI